MHAFHLESSMLVFIHYHSFTLTSQQQINELYSFAFITLDVHFFDSNNSNSFDSTWQWCSIPLTSFSYPTILMHSFHLHSFMFMFINLHSFICIGIHLCSITFLLYSFGWFVLSDAACRLLRIHFAGGWYCYLSFVNLVIHVMQSRLKIEFRMGGTWS